MIFKFCDFFDFLQISGGSLQWPKWFSGSKLKKWVKISLIWQKKEIVSTKDDFSSFWSILTKKIFGRFLTCNAKFSKKCPWTKKILVTKTSRGGRKHIWKFIPAPLRVFFTHYYGLYWPLCQFSHGKFELFFLKLARFKATIGVSRGRRKILTPPKKSFDLVLNRPQKSKGYDKNSWR